MCEIIEKIKKVKRSRIKQLKKNEEIEKYEQLLREECQQNELDLKNVIFDLLLLSLCSTVLKTHSQVSAYAKIFNPDLEIYRLNGCPMLYYPDSHVQIYPIEKINDADIKQLVTTKTNKEPRDQIKNSYLDF